MEASIALGICYKSITFIIKLAAVCQIFLGALGKIILIHKVIAGVVGRIYVPTDFDTKEKALSGAKAAEKGLK